MGVDNTLFFSKLPSHRIVRGSSFDAAAVFRYFGIWICRKPL